MKSEREVRGLYVAREPALAVWGRHVSQTVIDGLASYLRQLPVPRDTRNYLKIEPSVRVKTAESFVTKAFHRGKNYTDPLSEITDQVGVRFVVLLSRETEPFTELIMSEGSWVAQQDRDYESQRVSLPHSFDYESNHFVVRAGSPLLREGLTIPPGLPCEIQVRTLLQHAYAELSHDRLYKPECKVPDKVRRLVARGSALLETTDHMFSDVSASLETAVATLRAGHDAALAVFQERSLPLQGSDIQPSLELLRHWSGPPVDKAQLDDLLRRRDYIVRRMTERQGDSIFYAHPVGLLSYFLVDQLGRGAVSQWPFDRAILDQVAADLGIGLSD